VRKRTAVSVLAVIVAASGIALFFANPRPVAGRIDDLSVPAKALLAQLPGVAKVEVTVAGERGRLVHVLDWHFVPKEMLALEGRDFDEHLGEVTRVQKQQGFLVARLIESHGLTEVFVEGVTEKDMADFDLRVESYRETVLALEERLAQARELDAKDIEKEIVALIDARREDTLELGIAGQFLARDRLRKILPLDDADLLAAAKPVKDGKLAPDQAKVEEREDAMVKSVVSQGMFGLIVLGGGHDLSDNIRRWAPGWEYIRVWPQDYRQ
jgi:hypothetical protein